MYCKIIYCKKNIQILHELFFKILIMYKLLEENCQKFKHDVRYHVLFKQKSVKILNIKWDNLFINKKINMYASNENELFPYSVIYYVIIYICDVK